MGNKMQRVEGKDKVEENEVAEEKAVFDIKKIYWDRDGNLRHGTVVKNRDEEVIQMLQSDTNDESDPTKLWMIIPSRWVRKWLLFVHVKIAPTPPGPIDMFSLLVQDATSPQGWRPKNTLLPPSTTFGEERPGHYRRISLEAWINLVNIYKVEGCAIAVRGVPYDDVSRWRIFKDPKIIDINLLPPPVLPDEDKKHLDDEEKGVVGNALGAIGGLFGK